MMLKLLLLAVFSATVLSETDEATNEMERKAFEICESDKMLGLTWKEVADCEVRLLCKICEDLNQSPLEKIRG